ncbi:glycosyl hydrolase family 8 [Rivularia sp. UHCC 0363]|uniref:glycosyl hydrolase family 8 n=1 Tax=Rivularia sp. UHCC 0363 TaxID=3110244 RepID=UPI002B1FF743|nr:glycosyl hydrolase family 8 [Rivularia sp. UHCC 0363]MEA5596661.1 glycosyl hydrolase family 8 [Rivularia sp. UHCC 0363]
MNQIPNIVAIFSLIALQGCQGGYSVTNLEKPISNLESAPASAIDNDRTQFLAALPASTPNRELLVESWDSYRRRFIQRDGRVIDYEASDRSTSEGQAYGMLRAVLIDDPTTFALTLNWGENNLQRLENGKQLDSLWAWKWGRKADGSWGSIDNNFASDGDIDAITALILASRRWNRPEYLKIAKTKLQDLWKYSTVVGFEGKRYLLPGPQAAFVKDSSIFLNPSYFAPYAFRLFAQVDPERDWLSLVDSSYQVLEDSRKISAVNLPSDWVVMDAKTGKYKPVPNDSKLSSVYSFDAFRVWWRIALDASWFDSSQARSYLETSTGYLRKLWREQSSIPAQIDLEGKALVNYEATSQYAMLYAASKLIEPELAEELLNKKLLPQYQQELWDDNRAYYTQNLVWLGLLSTDATSQKLLQNN